MRRPTLRPALLGSLRASRALAILILVVLEFAWIGAGVSAVGRPIYPDLITSPPSGLYFERGPDGTHLLRFANTAVNLGGRLEIEVGTGTRDIYQNVYDKNVGGNRVVHERVGADLIYHPQHSHFHFEGFAKYDLLKKDRNGFYRETSRDGSKTTFCILDTLRIAPDAPAQREYDGCGAKIQGLSAGWGDTYIASLFGQWIELGSSILPDGSYAIRSTADPDNKLMELNDFNNIGTAYFSVRNGRLSIDGIPPLCSTEASGGGTTIAGQAHATVGSMVAIKCLRFDPNEPVDIYWGSVNTNPRTTVASSSGGAVFAQLQVPQSTLGVHYVIARGRESGLQVAAVVVTVPSVAISPRRGVVGTPAQVTLRGFSASEQIDVRFYKSGQSGTSVGVVVAGANGSGKTSFAIPPTTYGSHEIRATGLSSGATVRSTVIVTPSMKISPVESGAGSSVGVSLRGFAAGETVRFSLDGVDADVGEAVTSYSGSTSARYARITIPAGLAAGTYTVTAIGDVSRSAVHAQIKVTVPEASEDPAPTPTVDSTETATVTATPDPTHVVDPSPTSTATATMTATPIPNASPIAMAPADVVAIDSDRDGSELVVLDGTRSYDADGDALTFAWTIIEHSPDGEMVQTLLASDAVAEITLHTGEHVTTLMVTDTSGATGFDEVIIRIDPSEPPGGPGTPETVTNF